MNQDWSSIQSRYASSVNNMTFFKMVINMLDRGGICDHWNITCDISYAAQGHRRIWNLGIYQV